MQAGKVALMRLLGVALGVAASLAAFGIATVTGSRIVVPAGGDGALTWMQVAAATAVPCLLGWGIAILAERLVARPRRAWLIGALSVATLSMAGPLFVPGIESVDRVWLLLLHLAAAAVYIPLVARTVAPLRRRSGSAARGDAHALS